MSSRKYSQAEEHFSTILSLNPLDRIHILVKRSKVRVLMNSWDEALNDADEVCFVFQSVPSINDGGAGDQT